MLVGYVRVSTIEQNVDRQIAELKNFGVEKFFVDKFLRCLHNVQNLKK